MSLWWKGTGKLRCPVHPRSQIILGFNARRLHKRPSLHDPSIHVSRLRVRFRQHLVLFVLVEAYDERSLPRPDTHVAVNLHFSPRRTSSARTRLSAPREWGVLRRAQRRVQVRHARPFGSRLSRRSARLAPSPDGPLTHFASPRGERCRLIMKQTPPNIFRSDSPFHPERMGRIRWLNAVSVSMSDPFRPCACLAKVTRHFAAQRHPSDICVRDYAWSDRRSPPRLPCRHMPVRSETQSDSPPLTNAI